MSTLYLYFLYYSSARDDIGLKIVFAQFLSRISSLRERPSMSKSGLRSSDKSQRDDFAKGRDRTSLANQTVTC